MAGLHYDASGTEFLVFLLALVALACQSSSSPLPTPVPGETRESDCRPTTEHVPYKVSLPTFLPHGIELVNVCFGPGPPAEGLLDLQDASLAFSNADATAGFLLTTTPVDVSADDWTPIVIGELQAFITDTSPLDAERANFSVQLRRNDVTYIITVTMGPGNRLTDDEVLRVAESIP